jgi:ribosomal-protein-alanine N-acetyltransferase
VLTERLLLRELAAADFDALRAIDADPEVLLFRSRDAITPDLTREFLARAQATALERPRQQYNFAVVLQAGDELIGLCGLTIVNSRYDQAFLWYALNRAYWGQGYATEAARCLLRFGFEGAGLRRIFAECHAENAASARVLAKIGLRLEAPANGELTGTDRLRFALTAGELSMGDGARKSG